MRMDAALVLIHPYETFSQQMTISQLLYMLRTYHRILMLRHIYHVQLLLLDILHHAEFVID